MSHLRTFAAFAFPRPNFVFARSVTITLDSDRIAVIDRRGERVFESSLADLRLGGPTNAFPNLGAPYHLLWGPDGSLLRLGFRRTAMRTCLILVCIVTCVGVLAEFGRGDALFDFALGGLILLPILWAVRASVHSPDEAVFYETLFDFDPALADRETVPMPPATTAVGRFWLMVNFAFWMVLGAVFGVMFAREAFRPHAPPPSPEQTMWYWVALGVTLMALGVRSYRFLAPYRPWATAEFGGRQNIVNLAMPPLLVVLVLAVVAAVRHSTGW